MLTLHQPMAYADGDEGALTSKLDPVEFYSTLVVRSSRLFT